MSVLGSGFGGSGVIAVNASQGDREVTVLPHLGISPPPRTRPRVETEFKFSPPPPFFCCSTGVLSSLTRDPTCVPCIGSTES